jgi:hypothetical protein
MTQQMRLRNLLSRIFRSRGLLIDAYYSLKQGLLNFKLIAEGCTHEIETGQEPKEKGSFTLPEMFGGSQPNAAQEKGKPAAKAPPAKPPAKPADKKNAKEDPAQDEA